MKPKTFDLAHEVLDHALVDADGVPCGIADDVELDGAPGEPLVVVALRVGPGAAQARLPRLVARLARKCFGARDASVPWRQVRALAEHVTLSARAAELGLDAPGRRWRKWLSRVPGA
jgi:hypothetical protein